MFESIPLAPPDAILGLTEDFQRDPAAEKIHLGAGVYKDASGATPVLAAVKEAEGRLLARETTKSYLPIEGGPEYGRRVEGLIFGEGHPALQDGRTVTAHAPGGTGALRLLGDLLKEHHPGTRVWVSEPTWVNHHQIYGAVGLPVVTYPYYDPVTHGLAFDRMIEALGEAAPGDAVVLHGVCHNPSGVDPTAEQWRALAERLAENRLLPIVDLAYLGFAEGLDEDALGLRTLVRRLPELAVCTSFSKTLGLYRERVGALSVVTAGARQARAVLSQLKRAARACWSSPPSHGGAIAAEVLGDPALRRRWEEELASMRTRIRDMRRRLAAELDQRGLHLSPEGNAFIVGQKGMFSFTGLGPGQVSALRERFSIYMVASGRINVAGLTEANLGRFCDALAAVLEELPAALGDPGMPGAYLPAGHPRPVRRPPG